MANKIILKKSSVPEKVPQTGDLDYGELALNYADGKIYYKNSNNQIDYLDSGNTNTTTFSATAPSNPVVGDIWINSNSGIQYTYLTDGDGFQWVDFSSDSGSIPVFVQSAAPNYSNGPYMWIQTELGPSGNGISFWIEDGQ